MLLGGRLADLLGRRRVLVAGIATIAISSLVGGLAQSAGVLVGARLAQGLGAALTLPTALSILTTRFAEGSDRNTALGAWGGTGGIASAAGVLIGGALTEGPGWRWVMFVNPIACALLVVPIFRLIEGERARRRPAGFDAIGAVLVTGGMLLLVYALVRAPVDGFGTARTIGLLAGAGALLAAFVANERRQRAPLAPLSIFRINGLGYANVTQLVAFAGFLALFFYVTLYMQNVLGYSAVQTGLAYLPLCGIAVVAAGISSQLIGRLGTRPVIVAGAVIGAGGLYWLSRISVGGSYVGDLLPGLLLVGLGIAGLFVAVATAANAGVPADRAGLAAALLNASQWLGGALGLAIFTAVSTDRTNHLLAAGAPASHALTAGFQRALLIGSIFILAAAVIALRATNARGETEGPAADAEPEASLAA
jgi:MFS family permease